MKKLLASDKVYVKASQIPNAGRGVYAQDNIKKDEIIERCPVIEIPISDESNVKEGILITYFYYSGKNKQKIALALGFGSIYNHTYQPNAVYKIREAQGVIDFIALKNIKKDEEITVNYKGKNSKNNNPLWFEVK